MTNNREACTKATLIRAYFDLRDSQA